MEDFEREELLGKRVPKRCPFCKGVDGVEWSEFEIWEISKRYVAVKAGKKVVSVNDHGVDMKVFCTRCEEEIMENDV